MNPMEGRSPFPERTVQHTEWKIQKRSKACVFCDRPFSEGERYHSVLKLAGDCFQRSDYCCSCWNTLSAEAKKLFSLWQGRFSIDELPRKQEAIESTRAEGLFARLVQSEEPGSLKLAYVFALLLERKKKLIRKGRAERNGRVYVIYEHPGTGQAYMVGDMNIDLGEAESIQGDLNRLLAGEGINQQDNTGPPSNCEDS